uniref:Uncharacterized protein n=1 Tax=Arundo donax TaxID=35708 RepID=A0A0A9DTK7_ARUDO
MKWIGYDNILFNGINAKWQACLLFSYQDGCYYFQARPLRSPPFPSHGSVSSHSRARLTRAQRVFLWALSSCFGCRCLHLGVVYPLVHAWSEISCSLR